MRISFAPFGLYCAAQQHILISDEAIGEGDEVDRHDLEVIARRTLFAALGLAVIANGAVSPGPASLVLAVFALVLAVTAFVQVHRTILRRLQTMALVGIVALLAWVWVQTSWDPTGIRAHPAWRLLTERFGDIGGTIAPNRLQALWELPATVLPLVAFAAAIVVWRRSHHVRNYWGTLAYLGGAFAVYGLAQDLFFPRWNLTGPRVHYVGSLSGFYVNRNAAAAFLYLIGIVTLERLFACFDHVSLSQLFSNRPLRTTIERRTALFALLLSAEILALLLTKSRAGIVVGIAALIGLAVWWGRVPLRRWIVRRGLIGRAVAGGLFLLGLLVATSMVTRRFETKGLDDDRWCAYPAMIEMVRDRLPWGVGPGGFSAAFPAYRPPECALWGYWEQAHNSYIQGMAVFGWLFPCLFLVGLTLAVPPLWRGVRVEGRGARMATAATAASLACAFHSLVDFPLEIPGNAVLLAIMIASAIGETTDSSRAVEEPVSRRTRKRFFSHRTIHHAPQTKGASGDRPMVRC